MKQEYDTTLKELLEVSDPDVEIRIATEEERIKNDITSKDIIAIRIEKKSSHKFCPVCGSRMHSKGFYCRKVNDPVLINKRRVILLVYARKWICPVDNTRCSDTFNFVERNKRNTNLTPYRIVDMMKDLTLPISHIAKMFNVSDTYCFESFNSLVDLPRLPLSETISIDEVFLNIGKDERYVMVIMDYITKEIIDILPNRYDNVISEYFLKIPLEERKKVKYLVTDMYKPYLNYTQRFFPNSVSLIDSFHIVSKLISDIRQYILEVKRRYQAKDKERLNASNYQNNLDNKTIKESKEVYILKKYDWVLLKNVDNIYYSKDRFLNKTLNMYLDTELIEKLFFDLDKNFTEIRRLKELYIDFNQTYVGDPDGAAKRLDELIALYKSSDIALFRNFSDTCKNHRKEIINSFNTTKSLNKSSLTLELARISNGPMESFNNVPKDYKRMANGLSNFKFVRNRILFSTRKNASVLAIPKTKKEVYENSKTNIVRGSYKK